MHAGELLLEWRLPRRSQPAFIHDEAVDPLGTYIYMHSQYNNCGYNHMIYIMQRVL